MPGEARRSGRRFHLGLALTLVLAWTPVAVSAGSAPVVHVQVDPRVELFSILFRLAGRPEYNQCKIASYDKDIEAHFGAFRDHPAVVLARRLSAEKLIGYDAVMNLAIHATDVPGLREQTSFKDSLDVRWTPEDARALLAQTRQFVQDTKFEEFFQAHRPLYELTESRARKLIEDKVHLAWFERFFGARPEGGVYVIPGLVNGGANYGPKLREADGTEQIYVILGVWLTDEAGQPRFDDNVSRMVVHEVSHSFVNHLVEKHRQAFGEAGEQVFQAVAEPMQRQAYGNWKTTIDESLVRTAVVRYQLAHHGPDAAAREIEAQKKRSFLWIGELSDLLANYEASRDRYPTFDAFLPEVASYFRSLAPRIQTLVQERPASAGK